MQWMTWIQALLLSWDRAVLRQKAVQQCILNRFVALAHSVMDPVDTHNEFITCPDSQIVTQQADAAFWVIARLFCPWLYFKFGSLSLKSLVPSFLGGLRSSMTTRFLTLIHPCPVSDFRISQKCMRCRTVTFDKGVFCETITRFSFNASNNLEVPKKQIYQHTVEFASEICVDFSSCTETSCRAIWVLTQAISVAQAVKLSLRFYNYYTIRAQHMYMSVPWILKTKPFFFLHYW